MARALVRKLIDLLEGALASRGARADSDSNESLSLRRRLRLRQELRGRRCMRQPPADSAKHAYQMRQTLNEP
jgi:hypothetical protein